jgi:hypothetical protein
MAVVVGMAVLVEAAVLAQVVAVLVPLELAMALVVVE